MVYFITSRCLDIDTNCHANRLSLRAVTELVKEYRYADQWYTIESCFI